MIWQNTSSNSDINFVSASMLFFCWWLSRSGMCKAWRVHQTYRYWPQDDHAHERQAPGEKQVCRGSEPLIILQDLQEERLLEKAAVFTEVFDWKLNLASAAQMTHAFRPWVCSSWPFFPQLAPLPCHTSNQSTTNIRGGAIYQTCHRVAPLWYSKNFIRLSWWGSSWKWCPDMAVFMRNLINHWIWEVPTEFSDKPGRTQSHVLMTGSATMFQDCPSGRTGR